MVDHVAAVGGRVLQLPLEVLLHDDIEAATAFDGVPIGISDGLPEEGRFHLGRARVSGCPGLQHALGAVEMLPTQDPEMLRQCCLPYNRPVEYGGSYLSKISGAVQLDGVKKRSKRLQGKGAGSLGERPFFIGGNDGSGFERIGSGRG